MADQMQPQQTQPFTHQPLHTSTPPGQSTPAGYYPAPAQPFVPPAESFGSFGPLPDDPLAIPPYSSLPASAPLSASYQVYPPIPPTTQASPPQGYYPYAPGMPGMPPYIPPGMYAPLPIPTKIKKPLLFPLTRHASVLLQIFGMLLYSLIVALALMGCILVLLKIGLTSTNLYVNADGSTNGLSILVTFIIILVIVPAISVFSGAFFGSWRGLIVSLLSLSGGLLLAHLSDTRFGNWRALQVSWQLLISPAITAMVVGFVYERRKYAAWWKSMFTMFLGAAVLIICFFIFVYIFASNVGSLSVSADAAHMPLANYMATMAISFGCLTLIIVPVLGLFFAGIEGIIHAILAAVRRSG